MRHGQTSRGQHPATAFVHMHPALLLCCLPQRPPSSLFALPWPSQSEQGTQSLNVRQLHFAEELGGLGVSAEEGHIIGRECGAIRILVGGSHG